MPEFPTSIAVEGLGAPASSSCTKVALLGTLSKSRSKLPAAVDVSLSSRRCDTRNSSSRSAPWCRSSSLTVSRQTLRVIPYQVTGSSGSRIFLGHRGHLHSWGHLQVVIA